MLHKGKILAIFSLFVLAVFLFRPYSKPTLKTFESYPVKFAKENISSQEIDFELSIPKNWEWNIDKFETGQIIASLETGSSPDKDGFIDGLSVINIKANTPEKTLHSEFEFILSQMKEKSSLKIIESGKTEILNRKAYVIHAKSDTGTYGETESLNFICESKSPNQFYYLTAAASQTDRLKNNMAMLLTCLKSFKEK